MKSLYLGNGDKQFKFADTTTEIHLNAFDDGSAAALTANAKVRIKNDSGYLLEVSANVTITENHAIITSGQLAQLPVGHYLLELWDTVDGGTAIYPSDGFLALQINENVTGLSGDIVSSIAVDDFINQFSDLSQQLKNEVSTAVANGLKGDKGDDGLSAYQVAVINGYHGSQTDWLTSLVGTKGDTGEKGNPGKDFKIVKTFPSIAAMNGTGFSDGDFTMIASDVNDPDDGKLYVWNGTSFTYIADLSGSQGIKGDKGDKGDSVKGDTGDQGLSAYQVAVNAGFSGTVDQWLASLVGATGTVDNAGLTTAPAFVNLQTQVQNSAVGTNLLRNSAKLPYSGDYHNSWQTGQWRIAGNTTDTDDMKRTSKEITDPPQGDEATVISYTGILRPSINDISLVAMNNIPISGNVIVSFWARQTSSVDTAFVSAHWDGTTGPINTNASDERWNDAAYRKFFLPKDGSWTRFWATFNVNNDKNLYIGAGNTGTSAEVQICLIKIEKGSMATDWCPNPSEILTQADYAKIKAAIVALGGTLS